MIDYSVCSFYTQFYGVCCLNYSDYGSEITNELYILNTRGRLMYPIASLIALF